MAKNNNNDRPDTAPDGVYNPDTKNENNNNDRPDTAPDGVDNPDTKNENKDKGRIFKPVTRLPKSLTRKIEKINEIKKTILADEKTFEIVKNEWINYEKTKNLKDLKGDKIITEKLIENTGKIINSENKIIKEIKSLKDDNETQELIRKEFSKKNKNDLQKDVIHSLTNIFDTIGKIESLVNTENAYNQNIKSDRHGNKFKNLLIEIDPFKNNIKETIRSLEVIAPLENSKNLPDMKSTVNNDSTVRPTTSRHLANPSPDQHTDYIKINNGVIEMQNKVDHIFTFIGTFKNEAIPKNEVLKIVNLANDAVTSIEDVEPEILNTEDTKQIIDEMQKQLKYVKHVMPLLDDIKQNIKNEDDDGSDDAGLLKKIENLGERISKEEEILYELSKQDEILNAEIVKNSVDTSTDISTTAIVNDNEKFKNLIQTAISLVQKETDEIINPVNTEKSFDDKRETNSSIHNSGKEKEQKKGDSTTALLLLLHLLPLLLLLLSLLHLHLHLLLHLLLILLLLLLMIIKNLKI